MMDEMQKTLARRRAKVDRGSEEPDSESGSSAAATTAADRRPSEPGDRCEPLQHGDLELLKQEILREMRKEVEKAKLEIIEAIRMEFARR